MNDFSQEVIAKAKELYEANGKDAAKTAKALREPWVSTGVVVDALRHCGLSDVSIAKALASPRGLKLSPEAIAQSLMSYTEQWNPSAANIAKALKEGCKLSIKKIANVLWNGLLLDADDVVSALGSKEGLDLDSEDVMRVIHAPDGLNWSAAAIARLYFLDQDGYSIDYVARELYFGCDLSAPEFAKALRDGCGMSASEMALDVLVERLGLSNKECVLALRDGLDLSVMEAATARWGSAGAYTVTKMTGGDVSEYGDEYSDGDGLEYFNEISAVLIDSGLLNPPTPAYKTASEIKAQKKSNQGKVIK